MIFKDFDLPVRHQPKGADYVPPKARDEEEIARRRIRPAGTLMADEQCDGIAITADILTSLEDPRDLAFASRLLGASALNTSWYLFARDATVMRRRLKLPLLIVPDDEVRPDTIELVQQRDRRLEDVRSRAKTYASIVAFNFGENLQENHRRGINLPDTDFTGDIITKKDREDLVFGSEQDIDWVAMSFVQTPDDIKELRRLLGNLKSDAKIITKVETKLAIDNLEGIVEASDGIIIARGDLAVETLPESVPVLQRKIIGLCLKHEKLSIVATQMMSSMMEEPEPTRAEVSDVATAVIVGADAVMLSDETATGRYPIESVAMMQRIILYTQNNSNVRAQFTDPHEYNVTEAIASVIIELALKVNATAIVAETQSGKTAQSISGWRPSLPILVVTPEARIAQQLALLYGSVCFVRPPHTHAATRLTDWLLEQKILKKGNKIVTASGKYSSVGGTDTIKVRVLE